MQFGSNHLLVDALIMDGLTCSKTKNLMGELAEKTAKEYHITRNAQDNYAISSFERAQKYFAVYTIYSNSF